MKKFGTAITLAASIAGIIALLVGGFDYFSIRDRVSTLEGSNTNADYPTLADKVSKLEGKYDALTPQSVYAEMKNELAKLRQEAASTRNTFQGPLPPVGAIVPYAGNPDKLPSNWVLCKGQTLSEEGGFARDQVAEGLWGKTVPRFDGRVVRGITSGEQSGAEGGSDLLPNHKHSLEGLVTGWISDRVDDPGARAYYVRDDNEPGKNDNWLSTENGRRPQNEGHHRHDLVGDTGDVHDSVKFVPSYIAVHFIMRIN